MMKNYYTNHFINIILPLVLLFSASSYFSQNSPGTHFTKAKRPSLLVLGTAHFQNPGRDQITVQVEDIMTPMRQKEIQKFVSSISRYDPTHIAVEYPQTAQLKIDKLYKNYLDGSGKLQLTEIHQLGFRLGKALGHKKIYAIDWNGNPPGQIENYDWVAYGNSNGYGDQISRISNPSSLPNIHDMSNQTITEWLVRINQPDILQAMHNVYFDVALIGDGDIQPGANWVGAWYGRNLRIFSNLVRIADKGSNRVLVIYGLGHAYLLNRFAIESRRFELVYLDEVVQ